MLCDDLPFEDQVAFHVSATLLPSPRFSWHYFQRWLVTFSIEFPPPSSLFLPGSTAKMARDPMESSNSSPRAHHVSLSINGDSFDDEVDEDTSSMFVCRHCVLMPRVDKCWIGWKNLLH